MELGEKLNILADAAKYDVSCSSSGSSRSNRGGIGTDIIAEFVILGRLTDVVFLCSKF